MHFGVREGESNKFLMKIFYYFSINLHKPNRKTETATPLRFNLVSKTFLHFNLITKYRNEKLIENYVNM